jgi:TonB-dependent SusC/RagA subfamily outer membrane receptor
MDKTTPLSEVEKRLILEHETAHVEQHHWVDLFLSQLVCALQWFNPFVWLYRNAVKQNHEFLADRSVLQKGNSPAIYHATLINYTFKSPVFALTNSFSYYNKFKRITMMKKTESKHAKKFAILLLVPALALFLWAFAEPDYHYSTHFEISPETPKSQDTLVLVKNDKTHIISITTKIDKKNKRRQVETVFIKNEDEEKADAETRTASGTGVYTLKGNIKKIIALDSIYYIDKPDDSVIITGSGSIRKKDSSVQEMKISVDNESDEAEIKNLKQIRAIKELHAQVGKVTFDSTSTQVRNLIVGSGTITLRGDNNHPLIFIDGKECFESDIMTQLDPNSIHSITILKDGNAASFFGERARKGVMIIETKDSLDK